MSAHGVPRTTKDLDIFVRADRPNTDRLFQALAQFGAPLSGMTEADFRSSAGQVFQLGVEPNRIDLLQSILGVEWSQAWTRRMVAPIDQQLSVPFLGRDDLIRNKELSGRPQDLADVEKLRRVERVRRTFGEPPSGTLS